jgi:hypothetical protein
MRSFLSVVAAFMLLPISIFAFLFIVVGFGGAVVMLVGSLKFPWMLAMWLRCALLGTLGLVMLWGKVKLVRWIGGERTPF